MAEHPGFATAEQAIAITRAAGDVVARIPADLTRYADAQLAELLQELLRLRARAEGAALALVIEADARGVVAASSAASLRDWIRTTAGDVDVPIAAPDASRWAALAVECARPDNGVLAGACRSGRVPVATGAVLAKELRTVRSQVSADMWDTVADALIGYAAGGATARQLAEVRDVVVTQYGNPDWIELRTREAFERRSFTGFTPDGYGSYSARVTLDGDSVAQVEAVLQALSAPRPDPDTGVLDGRTATQRRADAMVEMAALVAQQRRLPDELAGVGNGCAQVTVTMDYEQLRRAIGYGLTLGRQPMSPTTVRRLACEGAIIPMILGTDSQPLDVGRQARLATPAQIRALRQRDKGCTFPGCDRPPGWTQAHHLRHWLDGGPTDLSNLALLCQRHHTIVHRDAYHGRVDPDGVTWHRHQRE